jgi:hypothetical protein
MSDIPKARHELKALVLRLRLKGDTQIADEIEGVVNKHLHRRAAVRKAPTKSHPLTPNIKKMIVDLADNPNLQNSEIATKVKVNPGRVSEVLHGLK